MADPLDCLEDIYNWARASTVLILALKLNETFTSSQVTSHVLYNMAVTLCTCADYSSICFYVLSATCQCSIWVDWQYIYLSVLIAFMAYVLWLLKFYEIMILSIIDNVLKCINLHLYKGNYEVYFPFVETDRNMCLIMIGRIYLICLSALYMSIISVW